MWSVVSNVAAYNATIMILMASDILLSGNKNLWVAWAPSFSFIGTIIVAFVTYKIDEKKRQKERAERIEDLAAARKQDREDREFEAKAVRDQLDLAQKQAESRAIEKIARAEALAHDLKRTMDSASAKISDTARNVAASSVEIRQKVAEVGEKADAAYAIGKDGLEVSNNVNVKIEKVLEVIATVQASDNTSMGPKVTNALEDVKTAHDAGKPPIDHVHDNPLLGTKENPVNVRMETGDTIVDVKAK